jgi:hypothetical protein
MQNSIQGNYIMNDKWADSTTKYGSQSLPELLFLNLIPISDHVSNNSNFSAK